MEIDEKDFLTKHKNRIIDPVFYFLSTLISLYDIMLHIFIYGILHMEKFMSTKQNPIDKIIEKSGKRIDSTIAQQIVDAIKADGLYSPDEKDVIAKIFKSEDIAWTPAAAAELKTAIQGFEKELEKNEKRQELVATFDEKLYQHYTQSCITDKKMTVEDAQAFATYIADVGYDEKQRSIVQFLYNEEAFTEDAEKLLKTSIAKQRGLRAHQRWVKEEADAEIRTLLGDSFKGKKIDLTTANQILDIVMKDGAYSDQEKATVTNLYNNADISEDIRDIMVDTLYRFTYRHGMSLDGSVLNVFELGVDVKADGTTDSGLTNWSGDREISMDDAKLIVEKLDLEAGLDEDIIRTIQFCIQTYPMSDNVQTYLEEELAKGTAATEEKQSKELEEVVVKAEKEEVVEDKKTTIKIQPSKTLMATYKELRNKNGKITSRTAQDFIDAIFLDNKYTKNEQETMRVLRQKGAFTPSANDTILTAIRRFVLNKNRR